MTSANTDEQFEQSTVNLLFYTARTLKDLSHATGDETLLGMARTLREKAKTQRTILAHRRLQALAETIAPVEEGDDRDYVEDDCND